MSERIRARDTLTLTALLHKVGVQECPNLSVQLQPTLDDIPTIIGASLREPHTNHHYEKIAVLIYISIYNISVIRHPRVHLAHAHCICANDHYWPNVYVTLHEKTKHNALAVNLRYHSARNNCMYKTLRSLLIFVIFSKMRFLKMRFTSQTGVISHKIKL